MSKTKKFRKSNEQKMNDYIKANRRGSRDAEMENSNGFVSVNKAHKSKKSYSRKPKHKGEWGF